MQRYLQTRYLRLCTVVSLALCLSALGAGAVDVQSLPKPTGYVNDFAHVVDPADKQVLEAFCSKVEAQLGVQFALVTIDSLHDEPIRDFAIELSRAWGVGNRKNNQGVLLLLVIQDRKDDIETGRGIEPYLTDGFSGSILRSMRPELRAGDYGAALLTGAQAMAQQIAQGKGIAFSSDISDRRTPRPARQPRSGIPFPLLLLGVFLVFWLLSRGGRGGGGFWTGLLLGNLLGGGRRYGGWGDRGGFGGNSGGGGLGGFGGGDFGGGGASSNW